VPAARSVPVLAGERGSEPWAPLGPKAQGGTRRARPFDIGGASACRKRRRRRCVAEHRRRAGGAVRAESARLERAATEAACCRTTPDRPSGTTTPAVPAHRFSERRGRRLKARPDGGLPISAVARATTRSRSTTTTIRPSRCARTTSAPSPLTSPGHTATRPPGDRTRATRARRKCRQKKPPSTWKAHVAAKFPCRLEPRGANFSEHARWERDVLPTSRVEAGVWEVLEPVCPHAPSGPEQF
jgi:hypothetical protein